MNTRTTDERMEVSREFMVRDFMSKEVLTVNSGSSISKAIRLMVDQEIGSVVVMDAGRL